MTLELVKERYPSVDCKKINQVIENKLIGKDPVEVAEKISTFSLER